MLYHSPTPMACPHQRAMAQILKEHLPDACPCICFQPTLHSALCYHKTFVEFVFAELLSFCSSLNLTQLSFTVITPLKSLVKVTNTNDPCFSKSHGQSCVQDLPDLSLVLGRDDHYLSWNAFLTCLSRCLAFQSHLWLDIHLPWFSSSLNLWRPKCPLATIFTPYMSSYVPRHFTTSTCWRLPNLYLQPLLWTPDLHIKLGTWSLLW